MKNLLIVVLFVNLIVVADAASPNGREIAPVYGDVEQNNLWEIFNEAKKSALIKAGEISDPTKSRKVKKGKKPEIIIVEDKLYFNAKLLRFGDSLQSWKKIIAGRPRCFEGGMILCVWDELGLTVATSDITPDKVVLIGLQLNFSDSDKVAANGLSMHGKSGVTEESSMPQNTFPGYLELDGIGIDEKTEFRDIESVVDSKRNLRCGFSDCSFPHGMFSEAANIGLNLDSKSRYGKLLTFGITISQYNIK